MKELLPCGGCFWFFFHSFCCLYCQLFFLSSLSTSERVNKLRIEELENGSAHRHTLNLRRAACSQQQPFSFSFLKEVMVSSTSTITPTKHTFKSVQRCTSFFHYYQAAVAAFNNSFLLFSKVQAAHLPKSAAFFNLHSPLTHHLICIVSTTTFLSF